MHWTAARGGEASCALRSYEGFRALEVPACLFHLLCMSFYDFAESPGTKELAASPTPLRQGLWMHAPIGNLCQLTS